MQQTRGNFILGMRGRHPGVYTKHWVPGGDARPGWTDRRQDPCEPHTAALLHVPSAAGQSFGSPSAKGNVPTSASCPKALGSARQGCSCRHKHDTAAPAHVPGDPRDSPHSIGELLTSPWPPGQSCLLTHCALAACFPPQPSDPWNAGSGEPCPCPRPRHRQPLRPRLPPTTFCSTRKGSDPKHPQPRMLGGSPLCAEEGGRLQLVHRGAPAPPALRTTGGELLRAQRPQGPVGRAGGRRAAAAHGTARLKAQRDPRRQSQPTALTYRHCRQLRSPSAPGSRKGAAPKLGCGKPERPGESPA